MNQTKQLFYLSIVFMLFFSTNSFTQTKFQKTFGNENGNQGNTVILTNSGGYAVAGWYDVDGLFTAEFYLINLNSEGDTIWTRTYGEKIDTSANFLNGSGNEGFNVIQTSDNGFLFVGERHKFEGGPSDVYAVKIAENGNLEWARTYGGATNDYGISVQETSEGDFVIGGYSESFGAGIRDMYLLKINNNGGIIWTKTYGGESIDAITEMKQTTDSGFILVGYTFNFGAGSSDIYAIKTDENGEIIWQKTYGEELNDIGQAVIQTMDGGYLIGGESESFADGNMDVILVKTNATGDLEWSKTYGLDEFEAARSVAQSADGNYVFAGYTRSFGVGGEDVYLVKTDTQGEVIWSNTYGSDGDDLAQSVKPTLDNGYILTGYTRGFGAGALDVYLIKTDELGDSGCHQFSNSTIANEVAVIENSVISEIGEGGAITQSVNNVGFTNTIIIDACEIVDVSNSFIKNQFQIFPNPTTDYLNIEIIGNTDFENGEILIYDILGKSVQRFLLKNGNEKIDVSNFPKGMYFLNLEIDNQTFTQKILKK